MKSELHFQPIKGRAKEILQAILQTPEVTSCSRKDMMVFRLVCEELVVNIASYAYPDDAEGYIDVKIEKTDHRIVFCFRDGGVPFNPLEHKMPDTSQSWEQRGIGGLGIFLVLKKMDEVSYAYVDNENVLTIYKNIES